MAFAESCHPLLPAPIEPPRGVVRPTRPRYQRTRGLDPLAPPGAQPSAWSSGLHAPDPSARTSRRDYAAVNFARATTLGLVIAAAFCIAIGWLLLV
jgi:hypothetical protein